MPLVWPLTRLAFCVWFEVKWNFYCRRCAVIYPTPETFLTTRLVANFSGSITKDIFSLNSSQFSTDPLWFYQGTNKFPHYMRSRQFTSFNPVLIPWNQITLPSLPPLLPIPCPFLLVAFEQAVRLGKRVKKTSWFFQITLSPNRKPVHRLSFCRLLRRLDKFSLSVLISKQEDPLLSVSKQLGSEFFFPRGGNSLIVLFDISILISKTIWGEYVGQGWVLPLHSTALCYFKVLFGSH